MTQYIMDSQWSYVSVTKEYARDNLKHHRILWMWLPFRHWATCRNFTFVYNICTQSLLLFFYN